MKTLTIALLLAISTLLAPQASAQRSGSDRYDEPSRFPILRKTFRQIRSDLRYHAGAIRDTASDIRHDVSASIRGETRTHYPQMEKYDGATERIDPRLYREPAPRQVYEDYYYEEAPVRREPEWRAEAERRIQTRKKNQAQFEPKIVAPKRKTIPSPAPPKRTERPAPKKDKPKFESKPAPQKTPVTEKPAPDPEPDADPKPAAKRKPAVGKIVYPEAKRSNRPGFHYSPFEPFELLDTQGIEPGALAKDPGNGKIFRVPK